MILKKPYALLIKYFKLINLLLGAAIIYLSVQTNILLEFFRSYISYGWNSVSGELTSKYMGSGIIFAIIGIMILLLMVLVLFVQKKKPITLYFVIAVAIVITSIIFNITYQDLKAMETTVLDPRKVRVTRDLLLMLSLIHYPLIIMMFFRATGFDMKKFEFGKDIEELEIEMDDREEFEVEFGVDTNAIVRNFNKRKRKLKYFIYDYVILLSAIGGTAVMFVLFLIGFAILDMQKIYKEKKSVPVYPFTYLVNDSYISNKNTNNEIVSVGDNTYVILNVTVNNTIARTQDFPLERLKLVISGKTYDPIKDKDNSFYDMGNPLNSNIFEEKESKDFLLVYEIPSSISNKEMIFRYTTPLTYYQNALEQKYKVVKLVPDNFTEVKNENIFNLEEKIVFSKSILFASSLTVSSFELKDSFIDEYQYCIESHCSNINEAILPTSYSIRYNDIMHIVGEFKVDEDSYSTKINNLHNLVESYGSIRYQTGDSIKIISDLIMAGNNPTITDAYIEVPKDINEASKIDLIITIRDKKYVFELK